MVEQHKLCCGKIGLALHSELVAPMSDLATLNYLHDAVKEESFVA
jgi:hypothetical protein